MQLTFISDTHSLHDDVRLQGGDVLIHCGDVTEYGTVDELADFVKWFAKQKYQYKIFIAGNHDLCLDGMGKRLKNKIIPDEIIYLENSFVMIEGIKIYGSPISPYFLGMAFNKKRGVEIQKQWDKIPTDTNILITHTPPFGIMDNGHGCEQLATIIEKLQPTIVAFGHIHEQHGKVEKNNTTYINAGNTNNPELLNADDYRIINAPIEIDITMK